MKYCFYMTFQVEFDDGENAFVELRAIGNRYEIASSDIESAREETKKKCSKLSTVKAVVLIHIFRCIYDEK